jgi:integrase
MAEREGTGSAYRDPRTGKFYAQIAMGKGKRKGVLCPLARCSDVKCTHRADSACTGLSEARERSALASELVAMLGAAGQHDFIGGAIKAATTLPIEKLGEARKHATAIASGKVPRDRAELGGLTFAKFAERLTNGELRKQYPDHVGEVGEETMQGYASALREYVNPKLGPLPLGALTLDHALDVMRDVPSSLSSSRRRQIAFVMRRVLALAAFPARLIPANPIPSGFLPKLDAPRARGFLWPDEEAQLIAGRDADGRTVVDLELRVLFALLAREGLRKDEAATLEYGDKRTAGAAGWVDLDRGWIYLDRNKTEDARDWPLSPDVAEGLRRWRKLSRKSRFVFPCPDDAKARLSVEHLADDLRAALRAVGVKRPELFEDTEDRRNIVAHDLRAVFVTLALAQEKSEAFITDRTGHTTSDMLRRYRRSARGLKQSGRVKLVPMHEGIPELAAVDPKAPRPSGEAEENESGSVCEPSAASPTAAEGGSSTAENKHRPATTGKIRSSGSSARKGVGVQVPSFAHICSVSGAATRSTLRRCATHRSSSPRSCSLGVVPRSRRRSRVRRRRSSQRPRRCPPHLRRRLRPSQRRSPAIRR